MMHIKRFEFNPIEENTYILYDETGEAAIIDCGAFSRNEKEELQTFIAQKQLTIKHLLCTHLHFDHIFGNRFIFETYHIKPEYDREEEALSPTLMKQGQRFGINIQDEFIPAGHYLKEGDTVSFGNSTLQVLCVPGHSPASLCFHSEANACIFTGDVLFRGSVGRSDLWGGNETLLLQGIHQKILSLPDSTAVYPGHGPVTTVLYEKKTNPYIKN